MQFFSQFAQGTFGARNQFRLFERRLSKKGFFEKGTVLGKKSIFIAKILFLLSQERKTFLLDFKLPLFSARHAIVETNEYNLQLNRPQLFLAFHDSVQMLCCLTAIAMLDLTAHCTDFETASHLLCLWFLQKCLYLTHFCLLHFTPPKRHFHRTENAYIVRKYEKVNVRILKAIKVLSLFVEMSR